MTLKSIARWGALGCAAALILTIGVVRPRNAPRFRQNDTRVETGFAGASASVRIRAQRDCGVLYVVWADARNGKADIYFNCSGDNGRTWLAQDLRMDTDAPGAAASCDPVVCVSNGCIYVAWEDDRDGRNDIYFNRSLDGGRTWLKSDQRLDTGPAGGAHSGDPQIECFGRKIYVVWEEDRNGKRDIYFRRSKNFGRTWQPEVVLNTNEPGASYSDRPRLVRSCNFVYVVWHDFRNGKPDIYLNRSADCGATWLATDRRLDTDVPGAGQSYDPHLAASGRFVYVAWSEIRGGDADVHFSASVDGGRSWLSTDRRLNTDTAGDSHRPQVACRGANVYVAWIDGRHGDSDVRINRSHDCGYSWQAEDLRLDTDDAGMAASEYVRLSCVGNKVFAAWEDSRDGLRDIRFSMSVDRGRSFLNQDLRADTDTAGQSDSVLARLIGGGTQAFVFWTDHRDGEGDIYVNSVRFDRKRKHRRRR